MDTLTTAKQEHNPVTNARTKFKQWNLRLSNGAQLNGISYVPPNIEKSQDLPLIIGIHGGSCGAHNYDMSPEYTASIYCDLLGVPFVAFNRPNYLDSSGWIVDRASSRPDKSTIKLHDNKSYFEEEGLWFHELIFPALWQEFAVPNGCASLVTTSHSMAVMPTVIAVSLYGEGVSQPYVWAGMVLVGLGMTPRQEFLAASGNLATNRYSPDQLPPGQDNSIHTPPYLPDDRIRLMLGTPLMQGEVGDLFQMWPTKGNEYKTQVRIPVLYGIGEYEWIWEASKEDLMTICKGFTVAPGVEGAIVKHAGHAVELSKVSRGWWTRVFGWALEVTGGRSES